MFESEATKVTSLFHPQREKQTKPLFSEHRPSQWIYEWVYREGEKEGKIDDAVYNLFY